jgi:ATP-dependent Lon protease
MSKESGIRRAHGQAGAILDESGGQPVVVVLPVLPIRNSVLFPNMLMPLAIGRAPSLAAVEAALGSEDKTLVVVSQRDGAVEQPGRSDLFDFGTVAVIKKAERSGEGLSVLVQGLHRVRLNEALQAEPYLKIECQMAPIRNEGTSEVEALHREMLELAAKIAEHLEGNAPAAVVQVVSQVQDPLHVAYLLASMLGLEAEKGRALLAANTYGEALRLMHEYLTHELHIHALRDKISSSAQSELSREQREYYLRRQLDAIREELGEAAPEQAEADELRRRLAEAGLPDHVRNEAERELHRLERMSPNAADYQLTRTYLDLVLELPWNKVTEDHLDLEHARGVLDEDHFDLQEVKDRILEHLAVMKLNPGAKAPILCFVGPPGVGKTSLGKSIARSLGRQFERLALGGLHDEAELRGHRRTYIGAMPGRVVQAIRRAGTRNPLIMLDEVDKLGRDFRGDPAAALMEILDPEQNAEFRDNYLDLPFDLSKVFFITTANTLDSVPAALLDRMEVLRLAGYSGEEKQAIARKYLIPRQIQEAGLAADRLVIPDETLRYVIGRYTREAGVRELERMLGRIARKVATELVTRGPGGVAAAGAAAPDPTGGVVTIRPDDLADMLGPERFFPEKARKKLHAGVATGLAWTAAGGDVLYVEAAELDQRGKLLLTGQLGRVMRESARAARSYLIARAGDLGLDRERIARASVHIHVPAGAVAKDGPSAVVTMVAALASLFSDQPVRSDTAMTGEITLSGLVLPVGGIKEKVLAAHRAGIRRVVLPRENEKDLREIPQHVREVMEFVFAERIEEVLSAAIPGTAQPREALV